MKKRLLMLLFFMFCICILCSDVTFGAKQKALGAISDISASDWSNLAEKRIFFGHQSVGGNIIDGINDILKVHSEIPIQLETTKGNDGYLYKKPVFLHKRIGKNQDPISKINDFRNTIENGFPVKPDIAFFKFCFVDFDPRTDVEAVFLHYKKTMKELSVKYPNTTFVHFTVPLTCYAPGISGWIKKTKDLIKRIIGKLNIYDYSSANIFNIKLIHEYRGKDPIFDLALYESTFPDGTRNKYQHNGETFYKLIQEYTYDGGHLNEKGRHVIAEKLLVFLADTTSQKNKF